MFNPMLANGVQRATQKANIGPMFDPMLAN